MSKTLKQPHNHALKNEFVIDEIIYVFNSEQCKYLTYLRDITCTLSFSRAAPRSVIRLFSFAKASFKSATKARSLFSEFVRSLCTRSAC